MLESHESARGAEDVMLYRVYKRLDFSCKEPLSTSAIPTCILNHLSGKKINSPPAIDLRKKRRKHHASSCSYYHPRRILHTSPRSRPRKSSRIVLSDGLWTLACELWEYATPSLFPPSPSHTYRHSPKANAYRSQAIRHRTYALWTNRYV